MLKCVKDDPDNVPAALEACRCGKRTREALHAGDEVRALPFVAVVLLRTSAQGKLAEYTAARSTM